MNSRKIRAIQDRSTCLHVVQIGRYTSRKLAWRKGIFSSECKKVLENNEIVGIISIGDVIKAMIKEKDATIEQLEQYIFKG